ncbi:hypothetical protein [Aquimarina algiphila]|uniref:hypothetical protein n=1 Tax=Aquimarina algiphila TaxID=2047982 RepID=UPI00232C3890|nr:hypothetical protein [Aquimarina algiphila]
MTEILLPLITSFVTGFITWFFARRKNNADARSAEIDNEVKAADFYKALLDDAGRRLDIAIEAIEERDRIIKERDKRIELLIEELEILTGELRKYKQLNGKSK